MFPHLSGWRVNLALLQEAASKEFLGILDKCDGTKVISLPPYRIDLFIVLLIFVGNRLG